MHFELRNVFNMDEHFGLVIARYSSFLIGLEAIQILSSHNWTDLDADFKRFYSMSYEESGRHRHSVF